MTGGAIIEFIQLGRLVYVTYLLKHDNRKYSKQVFAENIGSRLLVSTKLQTDFENFQGFDLKTFICFLPEYVVKY